MVVTNQKLFKNGVFVNAFIIGAVIMALEMTASRFLTPFFGNSVYTWASIISMVLLSLALGYFFGGYFAEKKPNIRFISLMILSAALLILLVPLYYESLFKWLYKTVEDPKIGGFFGAFISLFLPLLILGMYSPFSVKLLSTVSSRTGKIAGSLYAVSTIGSILGTLVVTFILIPIIGSKSIFFTLSFITFLSAISLFLIKDKRGKKKNTLPYIAFLLFFIAFVFIVFNKPVRMLMGKENTKSKYILEEAESEYNTILIKQKGEYISMSFRRHQSGHIESQVNVLNEFELPLSYSRLMQAGLLYQTEPKQVLMVGLGGGTFSTYLKRYYKNIQITGVELDAEVIRLSEKYFGLKEDEHLKVINNDGRLFLSNTVNRYDIIFLDAYKGGYIPFHLCTDEFYALAARHLTKTGVVVLNLHRGSKLFNSILFTLNNSFQSIDLYASETKGNVIAVAYQTKPVSNKNLANIADSLQARYRFYHSLADVFERKMKMKIDPTELLTDDFAPVNVLNAIKTHNIE